jgi:hypothetical protein
MPVYHERLCCMQFVVCVHACKCSTRRCSKKACIGTFQNNKSIPFRRSETSKVCFNCLLSKISRVEVGRCILGMGLLQLARPGPIHQFLFVGHGRSFLARLCRIRLRGAPLTKFHEAGGAVRIATLVHSGLKWKLVEL